MALRRPPPRADFTQAMLAGLEQQLNGCTRCELHELRRQVVFGRGNPTAPIMVVGAYPGYYDDEAGLPLSGETPAAQFMAALEPLGLVPKRDTYATYAVKCISPKDESKRRKEISHEIWNTCGPYLRRQIALTQPAILVLHGKEASKLVLGDDRSLRQYVGQFRRYGEKCIALSTHNPAGLFNERAALIPDYREHWRQVALRLNALGRLWRPDAECFREGWSFPDPTAPKGTIGWTGTAGLCDADEEGVCA